MSPTRREFLRVSSAAGGALTLGMLAKELSASPAPQTGPRALRILILGGTSFIGPHQVRYALERGHDITLFNRGRTNTHLFPDVERLVGDRNDDLESLRDRSWDVVIDNSASNQDWVRRSAEFLRDSVEPTSMCPPGRPM